MSGTARLQTVSEQITHRRITTMDKKNQQEEKQPDDLRSLDYYVSAVEVQPGKVIDEERLELDSGCYWRRGLPTAQ
jgi:hypothetical protein